MNVTTPSPTTQVAAPRTTLLTKILRVPLILLSGAVSVLLVVLMLLTLAALSPFIDDFMEDDRY